MNKLSCAVVALALVCAAQAISDAEPLRHHGRRLLNNFNSEEDAQSSTSNQIVSSHHMPGLSSTTAMQQGAGVTVEQLLGKNGHPADSAAVDSTAANDSNVLSADESSLSSEPAQVLGFKDNVKKAAQNAADGAAHLKDSVANKLRGSESKTAAVATVHTTAVTSSDAVGDSVQALALSLVHAGPIMLYNAYQSSNYDVKTHPAEAAIDGNIYTSSQTAVDTSGCKALNDDGLYGICGVLAECMTSPYYTGAYASTPSNPYWTAGFTSDISANFEVSQVVLTNRQECCRCPLAGANIYIGNPSNLNVIAVDNPDLSKESTWQLCATVPEFNADSPALIFSEAAQYNETFLCSEPIVGKAVAIQLPASTTILSLAEVQVVGYQL